MQILIFPTLQDAQNALSTIDTAIGYPKVNKNYLTREPDADAQWTLTWDKPEQCATGGYFISKPEEQYLTGVTGFTEETFDKSIHRIYPEMVY